MLNIFDFSSATTINGILNSTKPQLVRFDNATFFKFSNFNNVIPKILEEMSIVFKNEEEKNYFLNKNSSSI